MKKILMVAIEAKPYHNMSDVVYQGGWFDPELLGYAGLSKRPFYDGQVRHNRHVSTLITGES
jgi:hypothetical protein